MEYPYNWSHALAVGKFLNMFQRNADIIGLATWAQTVNVLPPIMTTDKGSYHQTIYTPLQSYRQYSQKNNLPIQIDSPGLTDKIKVLDGAASISDDGKEITISILNLSEKESLKTNVHFGSNRDSKLLKLTSHTSFTAPSLEAINTLEKNIVRESKINKDDKPKDAFELILQPASLNFLIFKIVDED